MLGPKPPPAPPPAHLLATPERRPDRRLGVQATPKRPAAPPTDGRRQAFPQLTKPKGEAENGNGCHTRKGPDTEQPQEERAAQRLDDKNFGVSPRTRLLAQTPKAFSKVAAAAKILKAEAEAAPPAAKKAKPPPAPPPTHLVPKAINDMAMHPPPKAKPTSLAASHWKQILKEAIGRQRPKAPAKKARRQACPQLTKAGDEEEEAKKAEDKAAKQAKDEAVPPKAPAAGKESEDEAALPGAPAAAKKSEEEESKKAEDKAAKQAKDEAAPPKAPAAGKESEDEASLPKAAAAAKKAEEEESKKAEDEAAKQAKNDEAKKAEDERSDGLSREQDRLKLAKHTAPSASCLINVEESAVDGCARCGLARNQHPSASGAASSAAVAKEQKDHEGAKQVAPPWRTPKKPEDEAPQPKAVAKELVEAEDSQSEARPPKTWPKPPATPPPAHMLRPGWQPLIQNLVPSIMPLAPSTAVAKKAEDEAAAPTAVAKKARWQACPQLTKAGDEKVAAAPKAQQDSEEETSSRSSYSYSYSSSASSFLSPEEAAKKAAKKAEKEQAAQILIQKEAARKAAKWFMGACKAAEQKAPTAAAKKARWQACPQLTKAGGEKVAASKAALPEKRRLQEKLKAAEAEAEEDWRHDLAMSFQKPRLAEAERQVNERKALLQEAETRIRQQKPGEDRMRMVVECMELKQQLKAAEKILDLEQQSTRRLQVTHRAAQVTREAGHDVQWERRIQARH